jgi:predicted phage-related endonuclease
MDLTPALIAATASLIAAGIAATASLLVSVLAKEQKTSEMRQQWIDSLRNDISELVADMQVLVVAYERLPTLGLTAAEKQKFDEDRYASMLNVNTLMARIKLRLNPKEHGDLLMHVEAMKLTLKEPNSDAFVLERDKLFAAVADVLKAEWKRVKKGEPAFYWAKRAALAVVIAALALIAVLVYRAA